jgi:hypothetical protein
MKKRRNSLKRLKHIKAKDFAGFVEIRQGADSVQNMPTHGTWKKRGESPSSKPRRSLVSRRIYGEIPLYRMDA